MGATVRKGCDGHGDAGPNAPYIAGMPTTTHEEDIAASAETVWQLVSAFGDGRWMRGVEVTCEGDGLGALRKVTLPTGVATEVCEVLDPETRTMGYGLIDGNPFPATDYHGRITITPVDAQTCHLVWSSTYETEADPVELDANLAQFLRGAAGALKRYAEANPMG